MGFATSSSGPMNRVLAHLLGWASLVVGAALIAAIMLVPPWLELQYAQWEHGLIEACAATQREQVEAYEHFASALTSNDPVLLQRLAHHHLRLKPSDTELVSLPIRAADGTGLRFVDLAVDGHSALESQPAPETTLLEQWLHKPHPIVGIDYPAYVGPDHMFIRLTTGNQRMTLLALGGVFLLCGLIMPGPARAASAAASQQEEEFVPAEIDEEQELLEEEMAVVQPI